MLPRLCSVLALGSLASALDYIDHTHPRYDDVKLNPEQLRAVHKQFDGDHDGKASVDELMVHFQKVLRAGAKENAHIHLNDHDADADRHLTLKEHLDHIANETRVEELGMDLATVMRDLDDNGDGRLSWYEFFHFQTPQGVDTPPSWKVKNGEVGAGEKVEEVDADSQARFDGLDRDENGYVTPEELVSNTITLESAKFKAADSNANGILDHGEIVGLIQPESDDAVIAVVAAHELRRQDLDLDGKLSQQEFFGEQSSEEEERTVWAGLDTNSDGFLDATELTHWESGHFHALDAFREALRIADSDKDGKVTAGELGTAAEALQSSYAMQYFAHWHEHHEL